MVNENIAAISTPPGRGGVAIIRISGDSPLSVAEKMFTPTKKVAVKDFQPNVMYTGKIVADGFTDFGMCVYFKAPKSFTGEDVVEFHCHGGVQLARGVLKAALKNGARAAVGGEFTKRAFLNGKLSLSSAEGMIDMINGESLALLRAGSMLYAEKLTEKLKAVQQKLKNILASIAADVDYPEEDVAAVELPDLKSRLEKINGEISAIAQSYGRGKKIKEGVTVALCGAPNVGKSSLLNALLGYDKAIVSSVAGTTRDAVEGSIEIDGVIYNLVDTAGLRERTDELESIGIEKAKKILASADVVISVNDGENQGVLLPENSGAKIIRVFNKCDISTPQSGKYDVVVSAATGQGLDELKALISSISVGESALDGAYIVEERHYSALCRSIESLNNAVNAVGLYPLDLISIDINDAWSALGEITGETANEEIISEVFSKFCVGK